MENLHRFIIDNRLICPLRPHRNPGPELQRHEQRAWQKFPTVHQQFLLRRPWARRRLPNLLAASANCTNPHCQRNPTEHFEERAHHPRRTLVGPARTTRSFQERDGQTGNRLLRIRHRSSSYYRSHSAVPLQAPQTTRQGTHFRARKFEYKVTPAVYKTVSSTIIIEKPTANKRVAPSKCAPVLASGKSSSTTT